MAEPFLAQITMVGFTFAPRGWAQCDGQILPIAQNQSLYSLLGTTYGGDGRTSFALPDMRGRAPVHPDGGTFRRGVQVGEENHTLGTNEIPNHTHGVPASSNTGNQASPIGQAFATPTGQPIYAAANAGAPANMSAVVQNQGGGQSHTNMQPYTTINFIIALQGLFPSRN